MGWPRRGGYVARIKAVRGWGLARKQEGDRAGGAGEAGGRRRRGGFAPLSRSGGGVRAAQWKRRKQSRDGRHEASGGRG